MKTIKKAGLKIWKLGLEGLIAFVILCLTMHSLVFAHKVILYAYAEEGYIYVDSFFADGTNAKNALIEVYDAKTQVKLLEGYTNEEGKFSFKIPKITTLKLVLQAGMGHRAEYTLSEEEIRKAVGSKESTQGEKLKSSKDTGKRAKSLPEESNIKGLTKEEVTLKHSPKETLAASEIEAMVERIIDKKLQPLMKMLEEIRKESEKPRITEVIAGIGYIIGILGIIAYFKGKKEK
ncbi:MAG: hypothetical protein ACK4K4_05065 [Caldimicrobium sp.]